MTVHGRHVIPPRPCMMYLIHVRVTRPRVCIEFEHAPILNTVDH